MPDVPGATPNGADDESAKPATGTPPETGVTPEDGNEPISVESFRKVQAEAKKYRLELREIREQLKARDEKDLTETERLERRAKEIEAREAQAIQRERDAEVRIAATAAGANAPDAVARLVDPDEEVPAAIRRIKRELPQLFFNRGASGSADGGAHGGSARPSSSEVMDALIRGGKL